VYVTFTPTGDGNKTSYLTVSHNQGTADVFTASGFGLYPRQYLSVVKNWNMVSLPLAPVDVRKTAIFTGANSSAFLYDQDNGYLAKDSLYNSNGYWVRYAANATVTFTGMHRLKDSIAVKKGWNLIGAMSYPLAVDDVQTVPAGIMESPFFRYSSGYLAADSLKPGLAYWIKVNADGAVLLDSASTPGKLFYQNK